MTTKLSSLYIIQNGGKLRIQMHHRNRRMKLMFAPKLNLKSIHKLKNLIIQRQKERDHLIRSIINMAPFKLLEIILVNHHLYRK